MKTILQIAFISAWKFFSFKNHYILGIGNKFCEDESTRWIMALYFGDKIYYLSKSYDCAIKKYCTRLLSETSYVSDKN